MKKDVRLYNVFFPIWLLLLFYPLYWLLVLPVNFLVDLLVIVVALRVLHAEDIKRKTKGSILKVWGLGFFADIIGGVLMFSTQFAGMALDRFAPDTAGRWWHENMTNAVMFEPFSTLPAFLWVLLCVAVSGLLIYLFNIKLGLKKAITDPVERRKAALALAIFTAPYTFFIPTPLLGG